MITKFNIFENVNYKLKIGDYIVGEMEKESQYDTDFIYFIKNNVGLLIDVMSNNGFRVVEYDNVPEKIKSYFSLYNNHMTRNFRIDEIILWSESKEELEEILAAKKYNL